MQVKIFMVPIWDTEEGTRTLNAFLRGNRILEVKEELVQQNQNAYWCFSVHYLEGKARETIQGKSRKKVDYRKVLDEQTFQKFSKLREIRKKVAADEGISAYIVFTDEELAQIAKLEVVTAKELLMIKGVGEKKVERFGQFFITKTQANEKEGVSDRADSSHGEP